MKDFRRTTTDIINKGFDKRKRYGIDAIPVIKSGTVFQHIADPRSSVGWWIYMRNMGGSLHPETAQMMEIFSEPTTPKNYSDLEAMGLHHHDHAALLDRLIEDGFISMEDLQAVIAKMD